MTNHLKIHIYTFILLSFAACFLTSCNEEGLESFEVPEVTHTCKMKLNADFTGFDSKDGSTRASINGWEDGDVLYLSFSTSDNNYVGGEATYDANNDDWTVTYSGSLTSTEQGSVKVYYFDGEVSNSTSPLHIEPTVGIYADLSGTYRYSSADGINVTATLTPQTSRIRFKGTPGNSITVSGINSLTRYYPQSSAIYAFSVTETLSIASDGYTPYVYGVFADSDNPSICIQYDGCKFTKICSNSVFQIGESGWMNVPTRVSHENWEMEELIKAQAVLNDSDNDGVGETLIFYYDDLDHSQEGLVYNINTGQNRPEWQEKNKNITNIIFDSSFVYAKPTSTNYWFSGGKNLKSISGIKYLDTSSVTSMSWMFSECSSLTELDVSNFNTSNVTDMIGMFNECSSLTELNVGNFNTSNVTNMRHMFRDCSKLKELNLNSFNTSKVNNMGFMFYNCSELTTLDLSKFNTLEVNRMDYMFSCCDKLTALNLSNFNTSNVTDMNTMFWHCLVLSTLDLSNFNTSNVTDMSNMFYQCNNLTSLDLSNFNTSRVTSMGNMFSYCSKLKELQVGNFDTSNVTDMAYMFCSCSSLSVLDVSNFDTYNVTNMFEMFYNCSSLSILDVSNFNTANVTNMYEMFGGCRALSELDVSNFNTSNVTSMEGMFSGCSKLTTLDISSFDNSNRTNIERMFNGCASLSSINAGNNDFSVCDNGENIIFTNVGSPSKPCSLIIYEDFDTSVLGTLQGNYYYWRGGYFAEPTMGWDINIDHPYSGDKDL